MKLEAIVMRLLRHGLERCGAGFGSYPAGVRHAIGELLPLVDLAYREFNGYGQQGDSIGEAVAKLDARLAL